MHSTYLKIFIILSFCSFASVSNADITVEDLIFDDSKPIHLKILEVLPKEAIIEIGSENSKNTIIEFMDYFCGYCKKMHPELIELANERSDVRIIFLQYPILNETSYAISKMVIAANAQDKGFDLHHAIFSTEGSLTKEKLQQALKDADINEHKLKIDMGRDEIDKIIQLSSFLAGGIGARGTPAVFVNENFSPGYVPKNRIVGLLK